ncbi:MAG TPA: hypothetical protein VGP90_11475 [Acidimicrobiia bacterium]|nr:hypothetical protein [Acidimicrobiia bacterium]
MRAVERTAARDAIAAAVCGRCRPVVRLWFTHADVVDLEDGRLCHRCLEVVDRLLADLMRHYQRRQ